ncbi:S8 family serine peptidase [Miltoncostaea marina]|uniref:S8 family serine peptidase n=1 Tax=Miltoncostaea marina TaxID=2843215 RepID=UPI001C3C9D17|nr:S8 family serine peptidase [Miltoncostaea marina]
MRPARLRRTALALAAAAALAVPATAAAGVLGQGGVRMGADALWSRGVLGQGERVAIVDEGFAGLDRSIALGELPPREAMTIRSFDPLHGLDGRTDFGIPTQHGVRMAELIHDVAPRARLVLVGYRTIEQFEAAAAWVAAEGIPVVSHSNSFLTPPFDGTGRAARAVDAAAAAGVLWVNSAGNYAQRHWRGTATAEGTPVPIAPAAGTPLLFSAVWDPGAAAVEVTVERLDPSGAWAEVTRSAPAGPGNAVTPPVTADGAPMRLVARAAGPPAVTTDVFSQTVGFDALAAEDASIPTPGDARGALTVGAVKWTGVAREPYSSVGPTRDGRLKPDLVGPTYVTSNPEWPGTAGTSAATAHVAAAAVLLRQWRAARGLPAGPADVRAQLTATALDLGPAGPDPAYGAGMARLDAAAPRLLVRVAPGRRRVVRVRATDAGTLRRVRISLDARSLRAVRRPAVGVRLPALTRRASRLTVTAEDMAGNVTTRTRVLRRPR